MRTRFCAMMRKPACSIIALIAPVRLRDVASGLMIEKVRSIAMGCSCGALRWGGPIAAAYNGHPAARQGVRCPHWVSGLAEFTPRAARSRDPGAHPGHETGARPSARFGPLYLSLAIRRAQSAAPVLRLRPSPSP